ncbi:endonuclease Q family protein [Patescibacteria group bacterium]|nr:endonuclease Q family protein [Patescibacteria group bacterium]MBU2218917.1 endonuclease Q family protein [Patescibacteria group bacterium]MBU2263451.1 endonuclease Q family protein [Patescibacteria group bacterium]
MKIVADLHIHSKYSRAVSQEMTLENIDVWARKKGIQVMATGDFTHPQWFNEIKTKLKQSEDGLYKIPARLRYDEVVAGGQNTRFMLTTEISSIYSKNGKVRRIHNLIFAPSIEAVEKINTKLGWIGNLKSDGRPILGLDSKELLKIVLDADEKCVLVPAHAWTPWFSIFGSMSGFDSIEECFEEMAPYIFAIETGLSSDPSMNWRLSALDKISLISNSDSHSLQKLGREANVFDCELSYGGIIDVIKSKDPKKFLYTIEFFPEEGKYHYDGHRDCGISFSPSETKKHGDKCPVCGKNLTVGVLNRVNELADRKDGEKPANVIPYKNLISLDEIIGEAFGVGPKSKKVMAAYEKLISALGSELKILEESSYDEIAGASDQKIAEAVKKVREGKVNIKPGYDGEYGKISIFGEDEKKEKPQATLF